MHSLDMPRLHVQIQNQILGQLQVSLGVIQSPDSLPQTSPDYRHKGSEHECFCLDKEAACILINTSPNLDLG